MRDGLKKNFTLIDSIKSFKGGKKKKAVEGKETDQRVTQTKASNPEAGQDERTPHSLSPTFRGN